MWPVQKENLNPQVERYVFTSMAYCEVLDGWATNAEFREFFSKLPAESKFKAFAWETPPLHQGNLDQKFEFVLTESPRLNSFTADPKPFSNQFAKQPEASVLVFPNLGADALMVVPRPAGLNSAYAHLAVFLRSAPEAQKHAFWQAMARAVKRRLKEQPIWVSTAGLGVHWLHGRVCNTPKYYRHTPYRSG